MTWSSEHLLLALPLAAVLILTACSPRLSPLYRDFTLPAETNATVLHDIREALEESGWQEGVPAASNVITTQPRVLQNWGLYRIVVSLDLIPISNEHVRVLVHPYRIYITGGRSKIPYMSTGLERTVLPDLNKALASRNMHLVGTHLEL